MIRRVVMIIYIVGFASLEADTLSSSCKYYVYILFLYEINGPPAQGGEYSGPTCTTCLASAKDGNKQGKEAVEVQIEGERMAQNPFSLHAPLNGLWLGQRAVPGQLG